MNNEFTSRIKKKEIMEFRYLKRSCISIKMSINDSKLGYFLKVIKLFVHERDKIKANL